jgi:hypothetical protein
LTINSNPFSSTWFLWCDIGIHRDIKMHSYYENFPNKVPSVCKPNHITFLEILPQIDDKYIEFSKEDLFFNSISCITSGAGSFVGAGCLVGDISSWKSMSVEYINMLKEFEMRKLFCGKEQTIYFAMIMKNKINFELIYSTVFGGNRDHWMSFPAILAGSCDFTKDMRFSKKQLNPFSD